MIPSYDPDGAPETRPRETKFGVGRNQVGLHQPERLHGFDDADERQLAGRVAGDGRFDRHARARQHVGGERRLPIAGGLQLVHGDGRVALDHSGHRPQVGFGHRAHRLRFGDAGAQLPAPDRQADADHRHPALPVGHRVGRPGADGRHRPEHVAHHLHVRLGARDLGASGDELGPRRSAPP